jgi:hypothetical protein
MLQFQIENTIRKIVNTFWQTGLLQDATEPNINAEFSLKRNRLKSVLCLNILLNNPLSAFYRKPRFQILSMLLFRKKKYQSMNIKFSWTWKEYARNVTVSVPYFDTDRFRLWFVGPMDMWSMLRVRIRAWRAEARNIFMVCILLCITINKRGRFSVTTTTMISRFIYKKYSCLSTWWWSLGTETCSSVLMWNINKPRNHCCCGDGKIHFTYLLKLEVCISWATLIEWFVPGSQISSLHVLKSIQHPVME